jgi:hypothetical protein
MPLLLTSAGYSLDEKEHLAHPGTTDPLLQEWTRARYPIAHDDEQRAALAACWYLAMMRDTAHLRKSSAQVCRYLLADAREFFGTGSPPDTAITGLAHLWQGYLRHGRRQLLALGDRVILEPELASGFGKGDLIVGQCLIDVKAVLDPAKYVELAFDHNAILSDGIERARSKLEYTTLATAFCQADFTVAELRRIYEIVWGTQLDPRNFHRKLTSTDFLEPTGQTTPRDGGRPASLYRMRKDSPGIMNPPLLRKAE